MKRDETRDATQREAKIAVTTASILGGLPQFFCKKKIKCTRRMGDRTYKREMKPRNRAIKWQRTHAVYEMLAVLEFAFNQKHSIYYHIGSMGFMYGCGHRITIQTAVFSLYQFQRNKRQQCLQSSHDRRRAAAVSNKAHFVCRIE